MRREQQANGLEWYEAGNVVELATGLGLHGFVEDEEVGGFQDQQDIVLVQTNFSCVHRLG